MPFQLKNDFSTQKLALIKYFRAKVSIKSNWTFSWHRKLLKRLFNTLSNFEYFMENYCQLPYGKLIILLNFSSCEKLLFCLLRGLWKMKGIRGENFLSAWVVYCYPTEVFRNFWKFFTPEKRLNRPEKPLFKQIWPKIEAQISRW